MHPPGWKWVARGQGGGDGGPSSIISFPEGIGASAFCLSDVRSWAAERELEIGPKPQNQIARLTFFHLLEQRFSYRPIEFDSLLTQYPTLRAPVPNKGAENP